MKSVAGAIAVMLTAMLALGACSSDNYISKEQPAFYLSMASANAQVDGPTAASMISGYRQNNGLGAVEVDPLLTQAAQAQSQAMAKRDKMDHDVGGKFDKRIAASGFKPAKAVENIGAGYHTLAEAFSGWRDSPSHKANMLATGVTKIGIATAYAPNSKYKVFWTLILAAPDRG